MGHIGMEEFDRMNPGSKTLVNHFIRTNDLPPTTVDK